ncbi:MAG: hypothetical protein M3355_04485, partial [Actinomycetota bacterium]|nr:hypothetical protein [Actinomycetota bacterium]
MTGEAVKKASGAVAKTIGVVVTTVRAVAKTIGVVVTTVLTIVLLDLIGVINAFDGGERDQQAGSDRLPQEYLYLDDERAEAYLGQLKGGLAATETRSKNAALVREAKLTGQVVQVGATLKQEETLTETASPKAADRLYQLEELRENKPGFCKVASSEDLDAALNGKCLRPSDESSGDALEEG